MPSLWRTSVVLLSVCWLAGGAAADAPPFDAKGFEALSHAERVQVVVAAWQAREAVLENCRYSFAYRMTCTSTGNPEHDLHVSTFTVARDKGVTLIDQKMTTYSRAKPSDPPFTVVSATTTRLDGKTVKALSPNRFPGIEKYAGLITDTRPNALMDISFNYMLGIEIIDFEVDVPRVEVRPSLWLASRARAPVMEFTVDMVKQNEQTLLDLHMSHFVVRGPVKALRREEHHFIDPNRGFMVVRRDVYGDYNPVQTHVCDLTEETKESKQVDGFWVPVIVERHQAPLPMGVNTHYFKLLSFSAGTVKPEDLALEFPPETMIGDAIKHTVTYRQKDGTDVAVRAFDPSTGQYTGPRPTTQPTTQPATEPVH